MTTLEVTIVTNSLFVHYLKCDYCHTFFLVFKKWMANLHKDNNFTVGKGDNSHFFMSEKV